MGVIFAPENMKNIYLHSRNITAYTGSKLLYTNSYVRVGLTFIRIALFDTPCTSQGKRKLELLRKL